MSVNEALLGTRIEVTTELKGAFGDAVAAMLMDEIDAHFSQPEVRARMTAKFVELANKSAGLNANKETSEIPPSEG